MEENHGLKNGETKQSAIDRFPILKRYMRPLGNQDYCFLYDQFSKDTGTNVRDWWFTAENISKCLTILEEMGKDITKEWT